MQALIDDDTEAIANVLTVIHSWSDKVSLQVAISGNGGWPSDKHQLPRTLLYCPAFAYFHRGLLDLNLVEVD